MTEQKVTTHYKTDQPKEPKEDRVAAQSERRAQNRAIRDKATGHKETPQELAAFEEYDEAPTYEKGERRPAKSERESAREYKPTRRPAKEPSIFQSLGRATGKLVGGNQMPDWMKPQKSKSRNNQPRSVLPELPSWVTSGKMPWQSEAPAPKPRRRRRPPAKPVSTRPSWIHW